MQTADYRVKSTNSVSSFNAEPFLNWLGKFVTLFFVILG